MRFKNCIEGGEFNAELQKNHITVLVGRNGYGKTTFLNSLMKYAEEKDIPYIHWNDMEYGRSAGKDKLLYKGDMEAFAQTAFHSEGESILSSFAYFFVSRVRAVAKKYQGKSHEMFLLIDQLDSGLDVCQLDEIKDLLASTIIPDLVNHGYDVYCVLSANSFELACREDCLDPRTGEHYVFSTLPAFKKYISKQY